MRKIILSFAFLLALAAVGCGGEAATWPFPSSGSAVPAYSAQGYSETVDHILNQSIVAKDPNVFKAEYEAGFLQGQYQRDLLAPTRDNLWDTAYLTDASHSFPKNIPPTATELTTVQDILLANYAYTVNYLNSRASEPLRTNMARLLFRLVGIYHGATRQSPASLDFSEQGVPALSTFAPSELVLGYETPNLTFADVYYINGFSDVMDVITYLHNGSPLTQPDKCSAFVKRTSGDIFITHNSWYGFLDQSMAFNLYVNDTFMTFNPLTPGLLASSTDFGYNNHGIMFNETTHRNAYSEPKAAALWMFFRAALAEQFATSLDDFYSYLSLEPSGTYCNGYAIADVKTREIGLVEMSYQNFIYFKSDGKGGYLISTKPDGISKDYDPELVQSDFILGINYPASYQIRQDLQSTDNRPARRQQFLAGIGNVTDVETSKSLITYTDPANPLSIYGRWDLGYGDTPYPKTVPDGSVDAKAISASQVTYAMHLQGVLDLNSPYKSFWMKYGTPYVNGQPFIWSQSQWRNQKLRNVPDRVDGSFHYLDVYIR